MPSRGVWEEIDVDFKACDGMPAEKAKELN
jgi:hypothetical protein